MKNPIKMFMNCKQCVVEAKPGLTPAEKQDFSAGFVDKRKFVIWCNKHDTQIASIILNFSNFSEN